MFKKNLPNIYIKITFTQICKKDNNGKYINWNWFNSKGHIFVKILDQNC